MKLSKNTVTILKNFSSINPSIYIHKGNKLRTIAVSGNIAAVAEVEDTFDHEFAIYDLNQFLNGIRLYDNPTLEFTEDNCVIIKEGIHKIKYRLTDPSLIFSAENRDIKLPSKDVCFILKQEHFEKLLKASSVFGLPDFSVVGDGNEISIQISQKDNSASNQVSIVVGKSSEDFLMNFKTENLKIIPGDYDVVISKELVAQFIHKNYNLSYYIGLELDSSFNL